jgi:hypothetical protein
MSTSVFQIPKNTGFTYGTPRVSAPISNTALGRARDILGTATTTVGESLKGSKGQYIGYFVSILVVLFAILTFIHFFITPIWQLNPGGPGVIPIPGMNDSKLYWTNVKDETKIDDKTIGFDKITSNWSMSIDIFVSEPFTSDSKPRIIFARCPRDDFKLKSSILLTDSIDNYNLIIALIPGTNDLIVSSVNTSNNPENVIVPNVPIQKPFRIGVVLFDSMMEVYINGKLFQTKQFSATTKAVTGYFIPPTGEVANTAKVKNLILWTRTITAPEMRYANPNLADTSEFDPSSMSTTSGTCPSK